MKKASTRTRLTPSARATSSTRAATKRALVARASRVAAVPEPTKIGQERMVKFPGLRNNDVFVTDDRILSIDRTRIGAAQVDVAVA